MAGIRIEGDLTGNIAEVDTNKQLKVNLPLDINDAGFAIVGGEINDGSAFGSREVIAARVSEEGRFAVGVSSVMFNDQFNYAALDTGQYRAPITTQTVTFVAGYAILNGANVTSINTNSALQTNRSFSIFGGFGIECGMAMLHTAAPQVNAVTEWGLFQATLPGAAIPLDGAYFRFTNTGTFRCIINYNGTETQSGDLTIPSINVNHLYDIFISEETCIFSIDGVVVFDVDTPAGQGQPFQSGALPFTMRHYIAGSAPGVAMQMKLSDLDVNLSDMNTTKPWSHVMAGYGHHAYQGQSGGTMGSTANYANSANPTAAVPTNTTAALGTGLGGQFWETATLALNTDGIICSFQNPAGGVAQTPRTLYITAVKVTSYIQAAITGGPFNVQWALAFGHTAVSLATAEAATTKAPRRVALGTQLVVVTQAVNTMVVGDVWMEFSSPIVVYPGEFVALVKKHVGTVGTAGVIAHMITFDGYFE